MIIHIYTQTYGLYGLTTGTSPLKFPIHAKQIISDIFLALSVRSLFGGSTFRLAPSLYADKIQNKTNKQQKQWIASSRFSRTQTKRAIWAISKMASLRAVGRPGTGVCRRTRIRVRFETEPCGMDIPRLLSARIVIATST